jgi:hypothetical protein
MRRKTRNLLKLTAGGLVATTSCLYATGYLEDVKYLLGGIRRGIRCGVVGSTIALNYLKVFIYFNLERFE